MSESVTTKPGRRELRAVVLERIAGLDAELAACLLEAKRLNENRDEFERQGSGPKHAFLVAKNAERVKELMQLHATFEAVHDRDRIRFRATAGLALSCLALVVSALGVAMRFLFP